MKSAILAAMLLAATASAAFAQKVDDDHSATKGKVCGWETRCDAKGEHCTQVWVCR